MLDDSAATTTTANELAKSGPVTAHDMVLPKDNDDDCDYDEPAYQENNVEQSCQDPEFGKKDPEFIENEHAKEDTNNERIEQESNEQLDNELGVPIGTVNGNSLGSLPPQHFVSHFRNPQIPALIRWTLPLALILTFALLLASDIGSGVSGVTQLTIPTDLSRPPVTRTLLHVSVFTALPKLWGTGSYALTVFICLTSISWPYVKLLLSLFAWVTSFRSSRRRERLVEWLDRLGKWSFVDIIVFSIIVVVFRSTINLGGPLLNVYVVPRWGIFGFVAATMLSLIETHLILHYHRKVVYKTFDITGDHVSGLRTIEHFPSRSVLPITILLLTSLGVYLAGCFVYCFDVLYFLGGKLADQKAQSVITVGTLLSASAMPGDQGKLRWLQIVWFFLAVVAPLLSILLSLFLLWLPLSRRALIVLFYAAEYAFAWSSAEVVLLSTIFAVVQIPSFGNGLAVSGCKTCYAVDSHLLPALAVLGVGTLCHLVAHCWLLPIVQYALYRPPE